MRSIILAVAILLSAAAAVAQQFQQASPHGTSAIEPDGFRFSDGARTCTVTADGAGICRRAGGRDWPFRLPTSQGRIDALYFLAHGDDLLMAYELNDGESGWANVVRLPRGAKRPAWRFHVNRLNMAAPVLHHGSVFVAALAFVAKIEVENGGSEWRLERAYVGGGFENPEIFLERSHVVVRSHAGTTGKVKEECFDIDTGACRSCGSP